ncbi:Ribosomal protein S18 acetylase RimI [Flavobacteriaceae bacterium MAR_2010_188]|nr:Ribosomal protein S18 acetylase RimI [Flavobacteriaceae bacterium MAR_2010_188]
MEVKRTSSTDQDFISLVAFLDQDLADYDGDEHSFYDQYNKITNIKYALVLYKGGHPVGCGAVKEFDRDSMEVKRMFVLKDFRGNGYSSIILSELEKWAAELGYKRTVLETGKRQIPAVELYKSKGYKQIENYGQYAGVENSICFEKSIIS